MNLLIGVSKYTHIPSRPPSTSLSFTYLLHLTNNFRVLLDYCLESVANTHEEPPGMQVLSYISWYRNDPRANQI